MKVERQVVLTISIQQFTLILSALNELRAQKDEEATALWEEMVALEENSK